MIESIADEAREDFLDYQASGQYMEDLWKEGLHPKGFEEIPFCEMSSTYLENCIKAFSWLDTSPLRFELESRFPI